MNSIGVLFRGDPTGPAPADKVSLVFDRSLRTQLDPQPGHTAEAHQAVRSSVDIKVVHADGDVSEATGHVMFYLTRGDSAVIPERSQDDPAARSSDRWWITRIEDETLPSLGFAPNPVSQSTLSDILRRYWNPR